VVLLVGLMLTFVGILFVRHPSLGFSSNVVADAGAVATGHLEYGNPATEFVGLPYPPVETFMLAGLLKIYWWEGWELVVSLLAAAAAMVSLVRMLWAATSRWEGRLATASVVVVLSMSGLLTIGLYGQGNDQLAWSLLVISGAITFRGILSPAGMSRRLMLVVGLLLTGSVFTKQTTVVSCLLVACLPLAVLIVVDQRRARTWKKWVRSATVLLTFAGTSCLLGLALQVTSRGFAYDLLVAGQLRYVRVVPLAQETDLSLRFLIVPLVALGTLALCVTWAYFGDRGRRSRLRILVAAAAVVVGVSPIPTAILAEAKLGGTFNHLAGPIWTLTLGCSVLLLLLRPSVRILVAAAIACGVLLAGIDPLSSVMAENNLIAPTLYRHVTWPGIDPFLLAAVNKGETVYDGGYPTLSASPKAPEYPAGDVFDILAAGYTPRWFIQNILDGRYSLVRPFDEHAYLYPTYTAYTSNLGRYDASVLWKLDLLIRMGYAPLKDPDSGVVYYQPTPNLKRLGWFAACFGPYHAAGAGVDVRVRGEGGLVCINQGGLTLSRAPAATTDVVMTLAAGDGEVSVHLDSTSHTLRVVRLDGNDRASSSRSGIPGFRLAVTNCLGRVTTTLTLRAVYPRRGALCQISATGPVLDVPVAEGESTAHVSIQLAAVDSPTLVATSRNGRLMPFTLLSPTPADINSL
jgi:hypothetical protein